MCTTCGCDHPDGVTITKVGENTLFKTLEAGLLLAPPQKKDSKKIDLEQNILSKNNLIAEHNRYHFNAGKILAINLVSSPGSGKTSLLERTLTETKKDLHGYVIEGDQQTMNDANRIAATGSEVVQINTGKGCHLDAHMVHEAMHKLSPEKNAVVFIENVGNLVCPAMFDLGEQERVVVISVTEGEDKPLKYPDIFTSATLCLINKIDLLPYVNFNIEKAREYARRVNPKLGFIEISATRGDGMQDWYNWLTKKHKAVTAESLN